MSNAMLEMADLGDIQSLCSQYGVKFSIEVSEFNDIVYCFGPVRWAIVLGANLNISDLFRVAQRLAASFPEKAMNS